MATNIQYMNKMQNIKESIPENRGMLLERNDSHAKTVQALAQYGVPEQQIAYIVDIKDTRTLHRLYGEELKKGRASADSKLLQTAYSLAVDDKNTSMLIFLMKTRLGMKETKGIELSNPDGSMSTAPSVIQLVGKLDDGEDSDSTEAD